jgi:vacuolar-type H+-ATPase subunit H
LTFSSLWQDAVFLLGLPVRRAGNEAHMDGIEQRHTASDKSAEEALREVLDIEAQAQAIIQDAQKEARRIVNDAEARARQMTQAAQERALEASSARARQANAQAEEEARALVANAQAGIDAWALQAELQVPEVVSRVLQALTLGVAQG